MNFEMNNISIKQIVKLKLEAYEEECGKQYKRKLKGLNIKKEDTHGVISGQVNKKIIEMVKDISTSENRTKCALLEELLVIGIKNYDFNHTDVE